MGHGVVAVRRRRPVMWLKYGRLCRIVAALGLLAASLGPTGADPSDGRILVQRPLPGEVVPVGASAKRHLPTDVAGFPLVISYGGISMNDLAVSARLRVDGSGGAGCDGGEMADAGTSGKVELGSPVWPLWCRPPDEPDLPEQADCRGYYRISASPGALAGCCVWVPSEVVLTGGCDLGNATVEVAVFDRATGARVSHLEGPTTRFTILRGHSEEVMVRHAPPRSTVLRVPVVVKGRAESGPQHLSMRVLEGESTSTAVTRFAEAWGLAQEDSLRWLRSTAEREKKAASLVLQSVQDRVHTEKQLVVHIGGGTCGSHPTGNQICTDVNQIDATQSTDFNRVFDVKTQRQPILSFVAEHVWEHLSLSRACGCSKLSHLVVGRWPDSRRGPPMGSITPRCST